MFKKLEIKNPLIENIIKRFAKKEAKKEKIYIYHENLEVLLLSFSTIDFEEMIRLKKEDSFYVRLLYQIKIEIERISGKILFLALREGNRVIIDSWNASWKDWEMESQFRNQDFMFLRDYYFQAKDKFSAIKCLEDYTALINSLGIKQLKQFFRSSDDEGKIKKLLANTELLNYKES